MWKPTIKGLIAHRLRLGLTTLAVVLGVAFVAGTFILTDTMSRVFDNLLGEVNAGVDVVVRAETGFQDLSGAAGGAPIPESLLDEVRRVAGVEVADGGVDGFAQIVGPDGEAIVPMGPPTLGVSWSPPPLTPLIVRDGRPPEGPGEVVIDAATARAHDFAVGDRVTILSLGPPEEFSLVGIVGFGTADNLAGATLAAFERSEAQRLFDLEGRLSSIQVAAADGVSAEALRARVAAVLPEGVEATTATDAVAEQSAAIGEALGFFNIALLVFAGVALFVGAFLIANTFTIVVAQRSREFALLRALGATGRQVTGSVLVEATIVGLVASVLGVALGALVATALQAMMRAFGLSLPSGGLVVAPRTIVVGLVVGLGVTIVSAWWPARRAARIEPIAALRAADAAPAASLARRLAAGLPVTVIGSALLAAALLGDTPNDLAAVGLGALLVFVGVALLSPLVVRPLARAVGAPGARLGMPGRLARGNAERNPRRTAATASALMVGLALVSFVAVMASSLRASVIETIESELRADYVVQGQAARTGNGFSPQLARDLAALTELSVVSPQRLGFWREPGADSGMSFLLAMEPSTLQEVADLTVVEGSLTALGPGTVAISDETAEEHGLAVGDGVPMLFAAAGERTLEVAAVFESSPLIGTGHLVSLDTFADLYTQQLDQTVLVRIAGDVEPATARAAIDAVAGAYPGVEVRDQIEFREQQEEQVGRILGLVTALLMLAIVIALLGITNTLALSVFERTREIGLLRAVGMSRRQTRSMIRWEALIVAVTGAVIGVLLGLVFGFAVVRSLDSQGLSALRIPFGQLVAYVAVAGVAGVLAGVLPARRAARLDVLHAITLD